MDEKFTIDDIRNNFVREPVAPITDPEIQIIIGKLRIQKSLLSQVLVRGLTKEETHLLRLSFGLLNPTESEIEFIRSQGQEE